MKSRILQVIIFTLSFLVVKGQSQDQAMPAYVTYYFVELIPSKKALGFTPEKLQQIQMDHMANIRKMVADEKLLLAGPFIEEGGGLFILNTSSKEDAVKLVESDPAVVAGRFDYKIKTWVTEKGLLSLEKAETE